MAAPIFTPNYSGLAKLQAAFQTANAKGVQAAFKVMRQGAEEWKRRIQRVVPVEYGTLRQSWHVNAQLTADSMFAEVGTSLLSEGGAPYAVYLEYGTARIAGGKMQQWQEGDEPIMEWKAKLRDLPNFRQERDTRSARTGKITERGVGSVGSKKFERAVQTVTKAATPGQGEQMPYLRPTGLELREPIVDGMVAAIAKANYDALGGKKF